MLYIKGNSIFPKELYIKCIWTLVKQLINLWLMNNFKRVWFGIHMLCVFDAVQRKINRRHLKYIASKYHDSLDVDCDSLICVFVFLPHLYQWCFVFFLPTPQCLYRISITLYKKTKSKNNTPLMYFH